MLWEKHYITCTYRIILILSTVYSAQWNEVDCGSCPVKWIQVWLGEKCLPLKQCRYIPTHTLLSGCLFVHLLLLMLWCLQYTDAGMYTCKKGERDHKIPGSYGHYEQDAQTYADWGVECKSLPVSHWKFDWVETFVFKSNMFIISYFCNA